MILLVTPSDRAQDCATALNTATGDTVVVAQSLAQATALLRGESFLAVILDQFLLDSESNESGALAEHLETTIAVPVNFAITGMERLVREVRAALKRRQREELAAYRAVSSEFSTRLNDTITALLLSVELAIDYPDLPLAAMEKLHSVHDLATKLRQQVEGV